METTTFTIETVTDDARAREIRATMSREPGVGRVLVRPDRREVYVRHSAARAPRERLLERLEAEGYTASVKNP